MGNVDWEKVLNAYHLSIINAHLRNPSWIVAVCAIRSIVCVVFPGCNGLGCLPDLKQIACKGDICPVAGLAESDYIQSVHIVSIVRS